VSPFSNPAAAQPSTGGTGGLYSAESYELTLKNVDMVLEEVRPYLVADGGNVEVVGVADGVISLRLQGDFLFPLTHFYLSVCEEVQQCTSSGGTTLLLNDSLHFHVAVQHCISLLSASQHHDQVFPLPLENVTQTQDADFVRWFVQILGGLIIYLSTPTVGS